MPSVSKTSVKPNTEMPGSEWASQLDGYATSIVQVTDETDVDLTPLLKGLPGDQCPSPHWGYVLKGRMWWKFDGHDEEFGPGEAFYVAPGHTAGADAGSEFVVFSPAEIMAEVEAHMGRRAQELFGH
jgi:hypothetical protein